MMMVELTTVPSSALPVDGLAEYLRLSRGFSDDGEQDARLESCLRAALASIEARIGKALFQRRFSLTRSRWANDEEQVLPLSPVVAIEALRLSNRAGDVSPVAPESYQLKPDAHYPAIVSLTGRLPAPPQGGSTEIEITAGYGADWDMLPADLQQAVLMLAVDYFEIQGDGHVGISGHVLAILQRYRPVSLRAGRP